MAGLCSRASRSSVPPGKIRACTLEPPCHGYKLPRSLGTGGVGFIDLDARGCSPVYEKRKKNSCTSGPRMMLRSKPLLGTRGCFNLQERGTHLPNQKKHHTGRCCDKQRSLFLSLVI